jgi:hypothetical protein
LFLEHCRVQSGQRIHDVGFGDYVQVGRAAIATRKHALFYGDSDAITIEMGALRGQCPVCARYYLRPSISRNLPFSACSRGRTCRCLISTPQFGRKLAATREQKATKTLVGSFGGRPRRR